MSVLHESDCSVEFLDEADTETMLEELTQAKMGISITEFRRRSEAGAYSDIDWDSIPGLVDVAIVAGVHR